MNPEVGHNKVRGIKSEFAGAARLMSACAAARLIAFGAPAFLTGPPTITVFRGCR